jgi:hypothetical protein
MLRRIAGNGVAVPRGFDPPEAYMDQIEFIKQLTQSKLAQCLEEYDINARIESAIGDAHKIPMELETAQFVLDYLPDMLRDLCTIVFESGFYAGAEAGLEISDEIKKIVG